MFLPVDSSCSYLIGVCRHECEADWSVTLLASGGGGSFGLGPHSCTAKGEKTEAGSWVSISHCLIFAHARPETIFPWPKWRAHKDNLAMSFLHFSSWTRLYSVCLSLRGLIMMSILSYLVGSSWLLIRSQHSTATRLVPAPQTTAEHITPAFNTALLFFVCCSFLLTLNKQNLTSVSGTHVLQLGQMD